MHATSLRLPLLTLGAIALCTLACAGRKINESKPVCDKPITTWRALKEKSKEHITKVCKREGNKCKQGADVQCRAAWTYGAQFHSLDAWRVNHVQAPVEDRMEAYFTYFLKPTVRMHEEYWAKAVEVNKVRQWFGKSRELMNEESKTLADDYIRSIRDEIRKTPNPKKKALLIDAYASMKSLNAMAFDPMSFDKLEGFKLRVRENLSRYDALKIKLEFVETMPPAPAPDPPKTTAPPAPIKPTPAPTPTPGVAPTESPAAVPSGTTAPGTTEEQSQESDEQKKEKARQQKEQERLKKLKDVTQQQADDKDQWSLD